MKVINIPNLLTIGRFVMTFAFLILMNRGGVFFQSLAVLIFTVASITDYLDGYIARKYALMTDFGKIADPIADKFLMLSAFFVFAHLRMVHFFIVVVIAIREIVVTAHRLWIARQGRVVASERAGKVKTILQIVAAYVILFFILAKGINDRLRFPDEFFLVWQGIITVLMGGVLLSTLYSGFLYMKENVVCFRKQ